MIIKKKGANNMKVLFLSNYPSPYRVHFFNELGKSCDLTVLFEEGNEEQTHRDKRWFVNNFVNFKAVFLRTFKILNKKLFCYNIRQYLKDKEFDIIIICNYSTLTGINTISYLKRNNVKFAIEADGGMHKDGRGFREWLKRYLISSANWWLSTSGITDKYFIYYGADKKNIFRYPFTSLLSQDLITEPISGQEKQKIKDELGINEDKVILSIGQFIHRKGFDVLINACKYIPETTGVYIIGGQAPEEYINQKNKLGLKNVHFVDFKPKAKLMQYFKASNIFVLPTREDIWGLVINEAMAFGLPVITTNKCVAGLELIDDGVNGYIVESENAVELGDKINHILNDDKLRIKMGNENLKKIQDYTIEKMAKVHLDTFEQMLQ